MGLDPLRHSLGALWEHLPERPSLMPTAKLPVYLIHHGPDAEDYAFVFDFEDFVARSRDGVFVRPALHLHAGRDDFDRTCFAGYFRDCFAREFEAMRAALATKGDAPGWFSRTQGAVGKLGLAAGSLGLVVLWLALCTGRLLMPRIPRPRLMRGRSEAARLENDIADLRGSVDNALGRITIELHPEFQVHAIAKGGPGDPDALDHSVWPLPYSIRAHLAGIPRP